MSEKQNSAWGYVRLSQTGREKSIDEQKRAIREYARANGLVLETTLNEGERTSGFNDDREKYKLLRSRVEVDEIDAVVTRDRARLSRDFDERLLLITLFRSSDVEWHVIEAGGRLQLEDTQTAGMEAIHAAMDDFKKRMEIERAREATQERMDDPDIDHGRPRYGMTYDDSGERQVPGEGWGDVVVVLGMIDNGATYQEIAEEAGVPASTAYRIVQNREWYEQRGELNA
jgi:DNA invertase Pin-like site-specific DNA recombinase